MQAKPKNGDVGNRPLSEEIGLICKSADDVAVSIARSFERMEERIDAAESRLYSRLADVEDKIELRTESAVALEG